MIPGKFDRQITVEKKSVVKDDTYGSQTVTWVPLVYEPGSPQVAMRFWANVQDSIPSKDESVQQHLAIAKQQTRLRMRYRDDIDSSMRIIVHGNGDTIYNIVGGPAMIGRKELIEMMLEKFSTQGE